jgi:60 kDa SS-A/Ro ribonucleoprotein
MLANEYSKQYDLSNLGFVAICPDVSGSMTGESNGKFSYAELAGMFAGVLARSCKNSCVIPWDTSIYASNFPQSDPKWRDVIYMYNYCRNASGGGTNMDLPIRYLLERRIKVDTFVLLTDQEEWAGHGWLKWWQEYLKRINPNAKAFLVRADAYIRHQPYPPETAIRDNIYQMMGYSDQVFKIMSMI